MLGAEILPGWETFVLMLPFGALLALSFFGLDARLAAPRPRRHGRFRFSELDVDGVLGLADPGGKLLKNERLSLNRPGGALIRLIHPVVAGTVRPVESASPKCLAAKEGIALNDSFQRSLPATVPTLELPLRK